MEGLAVRQALRVPALISVFRLRGPGLGTCMGPAQTMDLLRRSGFNEVEPLDIKSQTHLFYAARP